MKIREICELTGAVLEKGDAEMEIHSPAGLDSAGTGQISFLANPKYTPQIKTTGASALILNEKEVIERDDIVVLRAKDPYLAFTRLLRNFFPDRVARPSVHSTAVIDPTASVDANAEIMANAVIGPGCTIGPGVIIHPNVTLYENVKIGEKSVLHSGVSVRENCEIGARCIVHNNSTVGSDGFGYAKDEKKHWLKIPQMGRVVLEDDVEIGANTAIDCASVGETRIMRGAKIDNLVQIGHSCTIEEDALICAQTGLAGSSEIGARAILAGQVGIAGHLRVGNDVVITAKSATSHDVEDGKVISGIPAFDNRDWLRSTATFRKLGELVKTVRELEKKIAALESKEK
jgi:UDP-3-O-[3-hydroxymyristoyl] glucosamine N-acyltransferase